MKIEMWDVDAVKPYHRNVRVNDPAVAPVAASIRAFGFRQPVVVDTRGVIIVGHTRWLAAKSIGPAKIPVHVARDLTRAQIRAYRIADNRLHEIAQWDHELLAVELAELGQCDLDLTILGFEDWELSKLLEKARTAPDVDEVPEPPDVPRTKRGDLWILGRHRLLCGDGSKPEDLARLLAGGKVQLFNADPPYNVKVEPRSNNALCASGKGDHHRRFDLARKGRVKKTSAKMRAKDRPLENDFLPPVEFERLLRAWFRNAASALVPGGSFYVWGGYANVENYPPALKAAGFYFSQAIIWVKEHPVMTRKDFMGNHEWCFYGWKEGAAHRWFGPRNLTDVWRFVPGAGACGGRSIDRGIRLESAGGSRIDILPPGSQDLPTVKAGDEGVALFGANNATDVWSVKKVPGQAMVHLTEKPVELAARAMRYSSQAGETVLDLFAGSGSTLIAAEENDRRARLMEIDPAYCDVIVTRWENLTGKKAERDRTRRKAG